MPRNLVNVSAVAKGYGTRSVLRDVTLGVAAGDRIGVVGRNGDGKSTLLRLIAGVEAPDAGDVTRPRGAEAALLGQHDDLDDRGTIRSELVGGRADHEWAGDAAFRGVLDGLLGGVALDRFAHGLDTPIAGLSGGERRRVALGRMLLGAPELLLLDEPTNHLDVEAVDWLARHLAARRGSLLVVTHDRWFLDAVCTATWEVADGAVHRYEGGYAAYVLARAERERLAAVREERRRGLLRKELAWLRRGPPARTSKPRFRIEAANALIADEPAPRDRTELLRFAAARLGDRVLDAEDVSVAYDGRRVLRDLTWRLGPGDRAALVGVNGSGKTTLLRLLAGQLAPDAGARRARRHRAARAAVPGHRGDPRRPAGARVARGRPRRGDAQRRPGDHRRAAVRPLRLPRRPCADARARPLRRRAPPAPAHAAADGGPERPAARRADERPRHRHADRARGPARRLAGHARRRHPRPLVRRARLRRRLRAHRRGRAAPPAGRDRAVPRPAPRGRRAPRRPRRPPRRRPRPAP